MDITTVLVGLDHLLACWTSTELVQSESILFRDSRSRMMLFIHSIGLIAAISQFFALPGGVHESNHGMGSCPPFKGTFTVKQYQLYPENADFDFKSCLLYIGFVHLVQPLNRIWTSCVFISNQLSIPEVNSNISHYIGTCSTHLSGYMIHMRIRLSTSSNFLASHTTLNATSVVSESTNAQVNSQ